MIVEGEFKRYCASGACLKSPCKVNKTTYRVFDIVPIREIGDDEIMECYVNFEDSDCRKEIRLINLDEEDMDVACLDSRYWILSSISSMAVKFPITVIGFVRISLLCL